jgi:rhamnogalacturonyl hydrolase YesR
MNTVRNSLNKLYFFCRNHDWVGFDPFDGLNSKIFKLIPHLRNNILFRLFFLQLNKKMPINLRSILGIPKGRNPKGIGLFLSSLIKIYKETHKEEYLYFINLFVQWLREDVATGYSGYCWGYNFDWQSRAFFIPKGIPTVVNTSFIGRAFLEIFEVLGHPEYLEIARSACDFVLYDLNRLEDKDLLCYSYTPVDNYYVHNANALAASLLASVYSKTHEMRLAKVAQKIIHYVADHQQQNGSWNYGEDKTAVSAGIDNFHTGFILESFKIYSEATGNKDYEQNIAHGLDFYQKNFFLDNGEPKYFYNKIYPLDIHSATQAIVTLIQLKNYGSDQKLCKKILFWMIQNMQDKEGYFYYQRNRFYINKIPYMRWSQAWALYAMTTYLGSHE